MREFLEYILLSVAFIVVTVIVRVIYDKFKDNTNIRILNMEEYLPSEEIRILKQVFYLTMMTLFLIDIIYQISFNLDNIFYFLLFDVLLSLFTIVYISNKDKKSLLLIVGLIPFESFTFLISNSDHILFTLMDIFHIIIIAYMIAYFYELFKKYTTSHSLGYTILLLYSIIFLSFIWTIFVESVNPLDALEMVSNAFTSNGYAILGKSILGKINAIFLVWSGYVLSSVGTATLTVAILKRQYDKRLDHLEELIKDLKDEE